jgi:hypothetical protein
MPDETLSTPTISDEMEAVPTGAALLRQQEPDVDLRSDGKDPSHPFVKHFPEGSPLAGLPMQLDVTVPIPGFRVQDLLALTKEAILESRWPHTDDVPVWCGGVQLVWTEFEVVDQKLAVRVTRLG